MQKAASAASLLVINAYWGGLSFMWNALHPVVLPAMLAAIVPAGRKNTYLGLLTFAGLIIAMVLQPVAGAVSDRWVSRFGRRRPLMVIGTVLDLVFLSILGWAGGLTWILVGYVGLQFSSNTAQGPLQGLLRDRVHPRQLGVASSIKILLDLLSLVAASLIAGRLMGTGSGGQTATFLVITALLMATAAVTILGTREDPAAIRTPHPEAPASAHRNRAMPGNAYKWLIAERAAFLLGVYGLQAFGQYYLQDALKVPDPAREAGNLLSIIGAGTIVFVIAAGWLSDRVGAKRLLFAASSLASVGMLLMVLTTDRGGLYGAGSLIGAGMGLFLTSNWALANRMAPLRAGWPGHGAHQHCHGRRCRPGAPRGSRRGLAQLAAARHMARISLNIHLWGGLHSTKHLVSDPNPAVDCLAIPAPPRLGATPGRRLRSILWTTVGEYVKDETALVAQAQQGSEEAFTQLVEAYQSHVYNLCYRMLGEAQAAEDASQETFLRAFQHLHRYDHARPFATWLLSIAAHYCIDRLRRRRFSFLSTDEGEDGDPIDLPDPNAPNPESELVHHEQREQMQAFLQHLNSVDRAAIVLRYWHDCSEVEIASALHITVSAVKSRLHRARRELGRLWQEDGTRKGAERRPHKSPAF